MVQYKGCIRKYASIYKFTFIQQNKKEDRRITMHLLVNMKYVIKAF